MRMSVQEKMARFWTYIARGGQDECWPWQRCVGDRGYGFFNFDGETKLTHRLAYELTHGEGAAAGKVVRHTCDNPPCCNPNHLVLGTHKDNMHDKIKRGRARNLKGNECSWAKLTAEQIPEIRTLLKQKVYHKDIAAKFGVDTVTITDINLGRTWRHV